MEIIIQLYTLFDRRGPRGYLGQNQYTRNLTTNSNKIRH